MLYFPNPNPNPWDGPGRAGSATSRVVVADYRLAGIEIRATTVPETVAEEEDKASASSGITIF